MDAQIKKSLKKIEGILNKPDKTTLTKKNSN
jgi:hypothetical protein